MSVQPPVLLLKTKSSPHDGYGDFFSAGTYSPSFIPVLEHRFHRENLARVRDLFASGAFNPDSDSANGGNGGSRKYGGLIFTSQRAVEGFAQMTEEEGLPLVQSKTPLILYTVGPATARSLTRLRDQHLPEAIIYGADAGNGENLAQLILEHFNSIYPPSTYESNVAGKPGLLFLVGEQRRDIIPKTLMAPSLPGEEQINVEELVVYETGQMESFERDFKAAVQESAEAPLVWVVVFSPSGCEAMLRVLEMGPFAKTSTEVDRRRVFVATIGPTTRDHLRNKFGFEPDVCAEKPSPEGVGEGIQRHMESLQGR